MKQKKEKYDFKAFAQAIKTSRKAKGFSWNALADELNIAPHYIASIENSEQLDSLLDEVSDKGLRSVTATAKEVKEVETEDE